MARQFRNLLDILQDAEHVLNLELEELGKLLLDFLDGNQDIRISFLSYGRDSLFWSNQNQRADMRERYPSDREEAVLYALMEAWHWLQTEGLVAPRPVMRGEMRMGGDGKYFVTRRGKSINIR